MSIANHREDEYGGSLENRIRIVKEIVDGIHQECGSDFAVTIGLGVKSYITALNKVPLPEKTRLGEQSKRQLKSLNFSKKWESQRL